MDTKFRAWQKTQKIMIRFDLASCELDNGCFSRAEREDSEIMQFTGLKDKNGKEIFEGDIVVCPTGPYALNQMVIRYIDKFASFRACKKQEVTWGIEILGYGWEVIGNKYKNPELLKDINGS